VGVCDGKYGFAIDLSFIYDIIDIYDIYGGNMPNILIRDIDDELDKALRVSAAQHGRTREAEIKTILKAAVAKLPKKRSLADALIHIPKIDSDINIEKLFSRPDSAARSED
jgi:plasmid stability protein